MKFLCGRPGCGRESTATLQIDAISETVSLVDPKVSRDGVPLCPRHADATSPPLGWAMNDLRSTSQALNVDEDVQGSISSTPPRVRPPGEEAEDDEGNVDGVAAADGRRRSGRNKQSRLTLISGDESGSASGQRHMSQRQSIQARAGRSGEGDAIESRPARRREPDEEEPTQESFAFSFDFDDEDEPEELRASTPLLSRAFRSGSR